MAEAEMTQRQKDLKFAQEQILILNQRISNEEADIKAMTVQRDKFLGVAEYLASQERAEAEKAIAEEKPVKLEEVK